MIRYNRLGVLTAALLFALSLGAGSVLAAGDPEPSPPRSDVKGGKKKSGDKKEDKKKFDQEFLDLYRAAYQTIYDRHDYAGAISQLKTLGHDDRADVANLIGYAYRKLGNYQVSQVWYERALKADPNHVRTWQYYGLWQLERGNREQAQYHLTRIASLCGTGCAEYRALADALNKPPGTTLVY
ncbi:tetratricopeptide repeat protein [Bradyrhizobium sediminis]|uniref:Tetratricopeptide repeat protein n=1 Tax=Bradyrhizobium sediminis TaxID=2840469 RepID=A0A975NZN8_9BRAD|nr:tetratricopeptide repeat protein [Bradyrhizobium sediminis]QWG24378.1 tetratricopeptide repeat protein [Bradyrhizobium sediminis]